MCLCREHLGCQKSDKRKTTSDYLGQKPSHFAALPRNDSNFGFTASHRDDLTKSGARRVLAASGGADQQPKRAAAKLLAGKPMSQVVASFQPLACVFVLCVCVVCVCVCVYIYTYIYIHTHTCVCMY
jgi:hypothetical protein